MFWFSLLLAGFEQGNKSLLFSMSRMCTLSWIRYGVMWISCFRCPGLILWCNKVFWYYEMLVSFELNSIEYNAIPFHSIPFHWIKFIAFDGIECFIPFNGINNTSQGFLPKYLPLDVAEKRQIVIGTLIGNIHIFDGLSKLFFAIISIACSLRAGAGDTIITLDVFNKDVFLRIVQRYDCFGVEDRKNH